MTRGRSILCLCATALVLGASCADAAPDPELDASPAPRVTSFVNGGDCPPATGDDLPDDAGCVTTAGGDDGTLTVYALLGDDLKPRTWRVRLRSADLDIDQTLDAGHAFSYPRVIGPSDIDGDGRDEWWIKVLDFTGHGTAWLRVNAFVVRDNALTPLTYLGEPLNVNIGGVSRLREGVVCRDGDLVVLRAEAQDRRNTRWKVSERTYAIEGGRARFVRREQGSITIDDYNDPDLDPYYLLDCDGLVFPPRAV